MNEETEIKKPRKKKEPKVPQTEPENKKEVKVPKKEKVKKKFRFIPLTRNELLAQTSFTITWD